MLHVNEEEIVITTSVSSNIHTVVFRYYFAHMCMPFLHTFVHGVTLVTPLTIYD